MKKILLAIALCTPFLLLGQAADSVAIKTADSLIQVVRDLIGKREYDKALAVIDSTEALVLKKLGRGSAAYGNICFNRGKTLYLKGAYLEAEKWYLESKAIREKVLGKAHPDYASCMNNLGALYVDMGNYEKAEQCYMEAMTVYEKLFGKKHIDYAGALINMGIFYWRTGKYEAAEQNYLEAKSIYEANYGKMHSDYANCISNLGALYYDMGLYFKSEAAHLEALSIREKTLGKEHPSYSTSLSNLGAVYLYLGNYAKAEPLFLEAKTIREKTLGKEHPRYLNTLNNLGAVYYNMGNYEKAAVFFLEAKTLRAKILGPENIDYAETVDNLAGSYLKLNKNEEAEALFLEALAIREKVLGKTHPMYVRSVKNLAVLYREMGQYGKAVPLFMEAQTICAGALGLSHPDYSEILSDFSLLHIATGNSAAAQKLVLEYEHLDEMLVRQGSNYQSEQELAAYAQKFSTRTDWFFSFAQSCPGCFSAAYNNTLFQKGFLLNAVLQVHKLAQSDPATTKKFNQLKTYNRSLAAEYAKPIAERNDVAELEANANSIEKDLTRSVAGFGEALRQVTWEEVQQKLLPGEAAIEFVHYKFYTPKPTDSMMYAALLLLPGEVSPRFIPLFEEKQLDCLLKPNGKPKAESVGSLYSNTALYNLLWQPLEQALAASQTVYFSPTGLLHQLNLGAVPMPPMLRGETLGASIEGTGPVLEDRYHLIELGSTRQLAIGSGKLRDQGMDALLYGGIEYEMDSTAIASAIASPVGDPLASSRGLDFAQVDSTLRSGKWGYLRWTDVEVNATEEIFAAAGMRPTVRKGYQATEESFKAIGTKGPSPRVLHLATHGFFFPDPFSVDSRQSAVGSQGEPVFKVSAHPMIRAGLVLAGGNHAWQTGKPIRPDREDGILTAYEISQMNLSNTELVVLSACETGLGDIRGNEGVYGLQRAFKIAGAKYLIMSLWQVPDFQTQELMTSFYSFWLEDKMSIPDAFRAAQQAMKAKYKSPFLWAGFVLIE